MKFQNICLYETGKVAVSARAMSSDVRWRRIFHESPFTKGNLRYITPSSSIPAVDTQ